MRPQKVNTLSGYAVVARCVSLFSKSTVPKFQATAWMTQMCLLATRLRTWRGQAKMGVLADTMVRLSVQITGSAKLYSFRGNFSEPTV